MLRFLNRLLRSSRPQARPARRPVSPGLCIEQLESRLNPSVSYHGGPLLQNVEVVTVYYGDAWQNDPALARQSQNLDGFFADITESAYMDLLGEYGVGHGSLLQHVNVPLGQPVNPDGTPGSLTLTDQDLQNMLDAQITDPNSPMPTPDANTVYMVFTPPNIANQFAVDNGFYAYHSSFTDSAGDAVAYAVMPHPIGNYNYNGMAPFQQLTEVSSHELAESVTDPFGGGWYDDTLSSQGEIGDLGGADGLVDGYVVQSLWSNDQQGPVLPDGATWFDGSGAVPVPNNLGDVAYSFSHSDEYYVNIIAGAYQTYLGRTPDGPGLDYWLNRMKDGLTDEQLEAGFIGSFEYIGDHGGLGAGWVQSMYQDLLGRDGSLAEINGWTRAIREGVSPADIAYGIAASAERESIRVRADYEQFLGREPEQWEVDSWVSAFENGATNEDVVAGFAGSVENFQQHNNDAYQWLDGLYQDVLGRPADDFGTQYWLNTLD